MEVSTDNKDYWLEIEGVKCAGQHILLDLFGVAFSKLNNERTIQAVLEDAARAAGATILHSYFHPFQPQGVSGMVVLAESHISIHTWPERGVATIDIFMCGSADPAVAALHLSQHFLPGEFNAETVLRGVQE